MTTLTPARTRIDWPGIFFATLLTVAIVGPLLVVGTWAFTEVWRFPNVIPQQFGFRFWGQTLGRARLDVHAVDAQRGNRWRVPLLSTKYAREPPVLQDPPAGLAGGAVRDRVLLEIDARHLGR